MKRICHIDLNTFFCQCEILKDPSLKGKPIAVGSISKRGVISTSSYEARKYGVYSALPTSVAKNRCKNLIIIEGNYQLYEHYSQIFFNYLRKNFPLLEQASIDECYIDMTKEMNGVSDETAFLFDLQMKIYQATKLKCSIGLSYNRFLAKMASDMKKPLGITIIHKEDIPSLIWPLKIEDFYGIGKKTAPLLKEIGIDTIFDFVNSKDENVKKILGSSYESFIQTANGISSDIVSNIPFDPKSISAERTFHDDVTSYDEISNMIEKCASSVSEELKKYHKYALVVSLKLRTTSFITKSKRISLEAPTDEKKDIMNAALKIFDTFYQDEPLRLIGISIEKLSEKKDDIQDDIIKKINKEMNKENLVIKGSEMK